MTPTYKPLPDPFTFKVEENEVRLFFMTEAEARTFGDAVQSGGYYAAEPPISHGDPTWREQARDEIPY